MTYNVFGGTLNLTQLRTVKLRVKLSQKLGGRLLLLSTISPPSQLISTIAVWTISNYNDW